MDENKIYFKHNYWVYHIAIYLFLGGLGGGILLLSWIMQTFVFAGQDIAQVLMGPVFVSLICIVIGLFFLVIELGQPPVFYRAYVTKTSIIKWGAVLLTFASVFELLWILGNWSPDVPVLGFLAVFNFLKPASGLFLAIAGIAGFGIMVYTGVMLSTLKAHSFWATPALPVLFTVSALSTGCAGIALTMGIWPAVPAAFDGFAAVQGEVVHLLHIVDIVLVLAEITVLLIMVLSFLGAGNRTAQRVAARWVKGSWAGLFWGCMLGLGLVVPLLCYVSGIELLSTVAAVLVLCGGCLLRFMCVYSDDRAPLPGENRYYYRLQTHDRRVYTNPTWEIGGLTPDYQAPAPSEQDGFMRRLKGLGPVDA